jgi:alpha-galactosidase
VPIIDALTNDVVGTFQINVPNNGAIPGLADDLATEGAAIIDAGGIHRIQQTPLPKKIMIEVIQPRALTVEWILEAFLSGDRGMWLDGLLMVQHHQSGGHTQSYAQAKAYLEDFLSQPWNREMAEHFAEKKPSWAHLVERP